MEFAFTWVLQIAIAALLVWIHARIAQKAGYAPLWALTALVPPVYLVATWFFAFMGWPRDEEVPPDAPDRP